MEAPRKRTDPTDPGGPRRLVVIDDDELARAGLVASIEGADLGAVVQAMGVRDALAQNFGDVYAAVVEAVDPTARVDQVTGAAVVEHLRRTSPSGLRVVVVCSVAADDPVRRRIAEAGADRYVHRSWARRHQDLVRAVFDPHARDLAVPALRDREVAHRLGIGPASQVNRGVAAAMAEGLVSGTGWVGPRGRDRYARRVRFNQAARLRPVTAEGLDSEHGELVPSLRQIQRFHVWATRVVVHHEPLHVHQQAITTQEVLMESRTSTRFGRPERAGADPTVDSEARGRADRGGTHSLDRSEEGR